MHIVVEPLYSRRIKYHNCVVACCKSKSSGKDKFCCKHRRQYTKETNPAAYYYDMLKQNVKRRNIEFTLTLAEFRVFCERTGYLEIKGRNKNMGQIDRIRSTEGYHKDNIQVLCQKMNGRKRFIDKMLREKYGEKLTPEEQEKVEEFYKELQDSPNWVQNVKLDLPF